MTRYVLDCCSVLNLHCGWGGIQNFSHFGNAWCIGEHALAEIKYVRELNASGSIVTCPLTSADLASQFPLTVLRIESDAEADLMVRLAAMLDDGEAEGLALAASRSMTFCSDDAPVLSATASLGISVQIVSTPELLQSWAFNDTTRTAQLPEIVTRITELSRFVPHKSSPHLPWWNYQRSLSTR